LFYIIIVIITGLPLATCKDIYDSGLTTSGLYKLNLNDGKGEFVVFCDMSLQGGGWTVIQRRVDNTTSFNRNKAEYEVGFGKFNANFWLGLEKIKRLTDYNGETFELYIGVQSFDTSLEFGHVMYNSFSLGSASLNYKLHVSSIDSSSTMLDSLVTVHDGEGFSTPDNDVDSFSGTHCAMEMSSGWWFHSCRDSQLNGVYYYDGNHPTTTYDGIVYKGFQSETKSLKTTVMAVRPV